MNLINVKPIVSREASSKRKYGYDRSDDAPCCRLRTSPARASQYLYSEYSVQ